jgi:DNA-binding LytR/AlgR family response regulator
MMRVAIVEDHPAERQLMKTMCTAYFREKRGLDIDCATFAGTDDFIESWKSGRFDLVLLDCYLTDDETDETTPTGLDIARFLRKQRDDCPIVFITSSSDFAVLGYEVQAIGYLLKPVGRADFDMTMDRVCETLSKRPRVTHLSADKPARATDAAWQVAFGNPAVNMDRRLIAYCLSSAHYVEFTFADGTCSKIRTNFSDVEQRLTVFDNFYRTARGVLVNFDYVAGISNAEFVMKGGKHIPITKTAVTATCRKYAEYTFTRMRSER